ncbi:MAG: hypothetical protein WCT37_04925 [Patescibacteria group bacterium]|jgi:hypothetical protein
MYEISATLEGLDDGLLMHKFSTDSTADMENKVKKTAKAQLTPAAAAEDAAYRLEPTDGQAKGQLALPADHFLASMVGAASGYQIKGKGKKTYKDAFKGLISINPVLIGLTTADGQPFYDYIIDSRPVRNPSTGGRVVRHRPFFKPGWRVAFTLKVMDDGIPLEVVQAILSDAGMSKGVGDYRPRYGKFRIVHFEQVTA